MPAGIMIDRLSEEYKAEIEAEVGRPLRAVAYVWDGNRFVVYGVMLD